MMTGRALDWVDPMVAAILAAGALMLLCILVFLALTDQRAINKRMAAVTRRWRPRGAATVTRSIRRDTPAAGAVLSKLLPNQDSLRLRLLQSGNRITVRQYVLGSLVVGLSAAALMTVVLGYPVPVSVLGACAAGGALPYLFIDHLRRRRQRVFTDQFPEGIELIIRGLRTGRPLIESAAMLAREMPEPIGPEFQDIIDSVRLGNSLGDALKAALLRIDTPEFRFFVTAVTIQQTTGGNLGETLGNLADMLRKRRQMKQRIKAIVSEPKASAWILGTLPFIMFAIIYVVEADYVMSLFHDPRGHLLVGLALLSQFIGVVVMVRMVRFKF